jgi:hypothetical protein
MGNTAIAAISLIYMLLFVVFVFPSNIMLDKGGLRLGILIGFILTTAGMWVKCLINDSIAFVYIGQLLAAMAQPLIACAPAKLSALWFGQDERVIAITIATVS